MTLLDPEQESGYSLNLILIIRNLGFVAKSYYYYFLRQTLSFKCLCFIILLLFFNLKY